MIINIVLPSHVHVGGHDEADQVHGAILQEDEEREQYEQAARFHREAAVINDARAHVINANQYTNLT